ncbi:MAG: DNA repair protein [Lachnospiraceae bacterium]|nr:DNA repair protein [Lachnospiraceae bacterium]
MATRQYLCIDLKSFYASVECVLRGLDPMTTNLVVADPTRSEKTICLAISPSMKALGIKNRCRLFEIPKNISYIIAPPQMQTYINYSAAIYRIYLKYISREDIHVYSIDEAFLDVTDYLDLYHMNARMLGITIMNDIQQELGIRATCGIGTNLYLTKVALDIVSKHSPDFIGELDEKSYRKLLWHHLPLSDFWRIGPGTIRRLAKVGIRTMQDIAEADPDLLYRLFGIDAELLIDHANGRESVTIQDIKSYHAKANCLTSGQVLPCAYDFEDGELIIKEMMDLMCLDLVDRGLTTSSISLNIGYENRPPHAPSNGSLSLDEDTNSSTLLIDAAVRLYRKITDPNAGIRRVNLTANHVLPEEYHQYSFFTDEKVTERDHKIQMAVLDLKKRFGKNAVLRGMNLQEKATTIERNQQIGGHKAGAANDPSHNPYVTKEDSNEPTSS